MDDVVIYSVLYNWKVGLLYDMESLRYFSFKYALFEGQIYTEVESFHWLVHPTEAHNSWERANWLQSFPPRSPMAVQEHRDLGHLPLTSQVPQQGARLEVEQPAPISDGRIAGGNLINLTTTWAPLSTHNPPPHNALSSGVRTLTLPRRDSGAAGEGSWCCV